MILVTMLYNISRLRRLESMRIPAGLTGGMELFWNILLM